MVSLEQSLGVFAQSFRLLQLRPRLDAARVRKLPANTDLLPQPLAQEPRRFPSHRIAEREHVAAGQLEALTPDVGAARPVDEPDRDPHPLAPTLYSPFNQRPCSEEAGDGVT